MRRLISDGYSKSVSFYSYSELKLTMYLIARNILYVGDIRYSNVGAVFLYDISNSYGLVATINIPDFGYDLESQRFKLQVASNEDYLLVSAPYASKLNGLAEGFVSLFDVKNNYQLISTRWGEVDLDYLGTEIYKATDGFHILHSKQAAIEYECPENSCFQFLWGRFT